jgi:hypothetical protein
MTLVLTELSNAGIAMAADSAITQLSPSGKITDIDKQGWTKILRVPKIGAAISYWGMIGLVTQTQFDIWLQRVIDDENNYDNLEEFCNGQQHFEHLRVVAEPRISSQIWAESLENQL